MRKISWQHVNTDKNIYSILPAIGWQIWINN